MNFRTIALCVFLALTGQWWAIAVMAYRHLTGGTTQSNTRTRDP